MVVGTKDAVKLFGISIIACCAVLVCAMFFNFYIDVQLIEPEITTEIARVFYTAQVSTAKVVCLVSGGCLMATAAVMLLFYVKHYIDSHEKTLGILKALGYSDFQIARHFWIFGLSVLTGALVGLLGAYLLMPSLYRLQNEDLILPEFTIHFHASVPLYFVLFPSLAFSLLAILYAWRKLKRPVLSLLKSAAPPSRRAARRIAKSNTRSFLQELRRSTVREKKSLAFFIIFAAFCFSAMTQMSFSMKDLSSEMMGLMILLIGLVLAFTTLFLAITTVIRGNRKTIAMMRAFGYSHKSCCGALLGVYRPLAYVGFALGTVYQYVLLRIMVDIVFRDVQGVPDYAFDFPIMLLSLAVFLLAYELILHVYANQIKNISLKEIMAEE